MKLITGGDMPLNIREHSYLIGETAMTVWFTMYGISMDRLDGGMGLVREQSAEQLDQISPYKMAPATVNPVAKGLEFAEKEARLNDLFVLGKDRDFDAIVRATVVIVKSTALASVDYVPIEEATMQFINQIGTDEAPQRE